MLGYRDIGCAGYCSASSELLQVFACLLCLIERIGNSLNLNGAHKHDIYILRLNNTPY